MAKVICLSREAQQKVDQPRKEVEVKLSFGLPSPPPISTPNPFHDEMSRFARSPVSDPGEGRQWQHYWPEGGPGAQEDADCVEQLQPVEFAADALGRRGSTHSSSK